VELASFLRFDVGNGLADAIKEDLQELISVAAHCRKNGFEPLFEACSGRAQVERAKLHGVAHYGIDIEKRALGGNLARETEQISYQCFRPASLFADFRGR